MARKPAFEKERSSARLAHLDELGVEVSHLDAEIEATASEVLPWVLGIIDHADQDVASAP